MRYKIIMLCLGVVLSVLLVCSCTEQPIEAETSVDEVIEEDMPSNSPTPEPTHNPTLEPTQLSEEEADTAGLRGLVREMGLQGNAAIHLPIHIHKLCGNGGNAFGGIPGKVGQIENVVQQKNGGLITSAGVL